MKTIVNVIDLDDTLLKTDSSMLFYRWLLLRRPWIATILISRFLKILPEEKMKKLLYLSGKKAFTAAGADFLNRLGQEIDQKLIEHMHTYTDPSQTTVVFSASFDFYVVPFIRSLGFAGYGSTMDPGGKFRHLKREEKINLLQELFPPERSDYNYAVSDSHSDEGLLEKFRYGFLIKKESAEYQYEICKPHGL